MTSLREQLTINGIRLRNRIVMPPITTNYASPDGFVTNDVMQFYRERSKDVGLVIVEVAAVRPDGRLVPCSLGLWEDGHVTGMKRLADAIREQGAAAVVQLNHAGARSLPLGGEMQGASPSGFTFRPDSAAFAMSESQIARMVADFADAAGRAADAGFDGVEVHGAHFYLVSQFLSPLTNRRDDRYGGDVRGRAAFAVEVVGAIREKVGREYPVFFRLNAVEKVEGGQSLEEALAVSRLLADAGVDAIDVSLIAQGSWKESGGQRFLVATSALPKTEPAGANIPLARAVKEASGLPVIAVGKLGEGSLAEDAVHNEGIDLVAIGRQLIVDPDTAGKILSGKSSEIIPCEECMTCFATIGRGNPMGCKINRDLPGSA